jgi:hypothetical protein
MRNGDRGISAYTRLDVCLACGGPMEETLKRLGSLRCMDCRDLQRPLDPALANEGKLRNALSAPAARFWRGRLGGSKRP